MFLVQFNLGNKNLIACYPFCTLVRALLGGSQDRNRIQRNLPFWKDWTELREE